MKTNTAKFISHARHLPMASVLVVLSVVGLSAHHPFASTPTAVKGVSTIRLTPKARPATTSTPQTSTVPTNPAPATPTASTTAATTSTKSTAANAPKSTTPNPAANNPVTPASTPPTTSASDIASESICPGQASTANTTTVLVCMTAYARTQHGLSTITANSALMAAATAKAGDINSCGFSHTACGRAFNYWFDVKGYTGHCEAENIAWGQQSPGEVFVAWMNSPGHRENILNASYKDIGVAVLPSSNGPIWVMELGGC